MIFCTKYPSKEVEVLLPVREAADIVEDLEYWAQNCGAYSDETALFIDKLRAAVSEICSK